MSLPNDDQRRTDRDKEKKMVNNKAEKQDSWMPETPTKPQPTRQHTVDAVGGSEIEFDSSSSKKRKNKGEINDQLSKQNPKKIYRPKIISQIYKKTSKPQAKDNTPKPSTPKKKRSYVKRGPSCKRQLFDENSSTTNNELGTKYNSLQSYHEVLCLSSICLVEDKQLGPNFPLLFKKKRVPRQRVARQRVAGQRVCLQDFLTPFKKGKRSKSFIRKRKHWIDFSIEGNNFLNKMLIFKIKKIRSLKKNMSKKTKKLVYKGSRELVPYKRSSLNIDVLLDEETSRVWNLLKDEKGHEENDEMKKKYWEGIRKIYQFKVESFIDHMHLIQGDRRFLPWKGSVLDSIVGVFLTQNVADYLSSSAYMTLASTFPMKKQEPIKDNVVFSSPEFEKEMEQTDLEEVEAQKAKNFFKVDDNGTTDYSSLRVEKEDPLGMHFSEKKIVVGKKNTNKEEKEKLMEEKRQYWDTLRKVHTKVPQDSDHMDSVDWEAVRCAKASKVAETIESRGQHNIIGARIQHLLNSLMGSNGNMDLEWLRYAPPKEVKEYLLTIHGLGLKSVECIRLLTLYHSAFPVDINVARIVVRLGWVPLQPLPESILIHNLEMFPDSNKIQQYLWPRLCTLDQHTLYELHYQMITFGKVFCTKRNPNCNACPLRNECKHFASVMASAKLALPEPASNESTIVTQKLVVPESTFISEVKKCEPIIELPASPEPEDTKLDEFEVKDDEKFYKDDYNDDNENIPMINLNNEETHNYSLEESEHDMDKSTTLVVLHPNATNIPVSKMKNVSRLKTERLVYVLPDNHPLLAECSPREPHDPSPYLLVIWTTGELENSCESTKNSLQEEENSLMVPGTLLIPCRTAMRGRFPLNGTYFQVNEVFVDHASMIHPINVPRKWLWRLEKRIVYFGTAISSIMKGLSLLQIHDCFWKGFICVRAFDVETRAPRPISTILHRSTKAKFGKENKNVHADKE